MTKTIKMLCPHCLGVKCHHCDNTGMINASVSVPNTHGGKRAGAGRKTTAKKEYTMRITEAEKELILHNRKKCLKNNLK